MWRNCARLLVAFAVLFGSGPLILWTAAGWKYTWQKQVVVASKHEPVSLIDPNLAKDPSIESAKLNVIGPLPNALEPQGEIPGPTSDKTEVIKGNAAENAPGNTPQNAYQASPFDLVGHAEPQAPRHFRSTFRVSSYRYFRLVVPAHATFPKLHGTFISWSSDPVKPAHAAASRLLD